MGLLEAKSTWQVGIQGSGRMPMVNPLQCIARFKGMVVNIPNTQLIGRELYRSRQCRLIPYSIVGGEYFLCVIDRAFTFPFTVIDS